MFLLNKSIAHSRQMQIRQDFLYQILVNAAPKSAPAIVNSQLISFKVVANEGTQQNSSVPPEPNNIQSTNKCSGAMPEFENTRFHSSKWPLCWRHCHIHNEENVINYDFRLTLVHQRRYYKVPLWTKIVGNQCLIVHGTESI